MKHLAADDLLQLRTRLSAREARLVGEIEATQRQIDERDLAGADLDPGQVDYAAALVRANLLRDQREIEQVRSALVRMDRGTYGRCLACGVGIPCARLHAEPATEYCHVCQMRVEGE
ncbi:MAG: TraR/DksA family transcriptional regulator [Xanthomonadales bacterium]|nr:RNA polymerase-binding transcription factor DksA [Xanthomonadales bacterium]MCC6594646.1 TraR/DksA family transcriptional regulator [Xanthomonadales bacterium]MCE7932263.1 TraR/DksA family transcriptional regulator [Xanthomonadales bacterium PRO6]